MNEDSKKSSKKLELRSPKGFQSHGTEEQIEALKDVVAEWAELYDVDHATAANMLVAMASLEAYMNWKETAASPSQVLRTISAFHVEALFADEQRAFEGNFKPHRTIN